MATRFSAGGRKRAVFVAYALVQSAVYFFGWPILLLHEHPQIEASDFTKWGYLYQAGVWIPAVLILQGEFLLPISKPTVGRSGKVAVAAVAGLAVAVVVALGAWLIGLGLGAAGIGALEPEGDHIWYWPFWTGFGAGLCAVPWFIRRLRNGVPVALSVAIAVLISGVVVVALVLAALGAANLLGASPDKEWAQRAWALGALGTLVLAWVVATPLLLAFARRHHPEYALSRIASLLFLGTLIEAAAIIPLDVMVRRKTSCYCGEGTFFALTALWSVGLLILGPAVFLLPLGRRRKRLLEGRCEVCGYDLSGTPGIERCPECGSGWKERSGNAAESANPPGPSARDEVL